ncbi:MAG: YggS family pyridoxal phosphate-dependent enzyme [Tenacibaculum sp.]
MIKKSLQNIKNNLPKGVTLVAVSKTKTVADIQEAYLAGQRVFGENKVQEMLSKYNSLPKDIQWHLVGHLQKNKVRYMAHFINLIHGVDSFKTLQEIDKQAKKHNRVINCLLQAKIAKEDTKFGLLFTEIEKILLSQELNALKGVQVVGLMGMATFTDNQKQLSEEFCSLNNFFKHLKSKYPRLQILSMGMSGDYQIALKNGATMIRIGSSIFGTRNYTNNT